MTSVITWQMTDTTLNSYSIRKIVHKGRDNMEVNFMCAMRILWLVVMRVWSVAYYKLWNSNRRADKLKPWFRGGLEHIYVRGENIKPISSSQCNGYIKKKLCRIASQRSHSEGVDFGVGIFHDAWQCKCRARRNRTSFKIRLIKPWTSV